jgi:hypothetical protein
VRRKQDWVSELTRGFKREHKLLGCRFVDMKRAVVIVGISLTLAMAAGSYIVRSDGSQIASKSPSAMPPLTAHTKVQPDQVARVWADPPLREDRTPALEVASVEDRSIDLAAVSTLIHASEPRALLRPDTSRRMNPRSALRAAKAVRPARYVSLQTSRQQGRYKVQPSAPVQPIASEPASAPVEVEPLEFSLASR